MLAIGNITNFAMKKLQHFYTKNDPKEGKLESYLTVFMPRLISSHLIICPINK